MTNALAIVVALAVFIAAMSGLLIWRRKIGAARRALELSVLRYRSLFDNSPCPMWVYDPETRKILEVNDAAVAQYGYTREEFAAMTLDKLQAPEKPGDAEPTPCAEDAIDKEVQFARHRSKNGCEIDVEIRGRPISIGGLNAGLGLVTDVTHRVLTERRIRDSERRATATSEMLQSLLDVAPQAIVVVDPDWRVTRWNRAAESLFGWPAAEVLGQPLPILPPEEGPQSRVAETIEASAHTGRLEEVVRLRKDGTRVSALRAAAVLGDSNGHARGFIGVFTDLTERKRLEEQLRQSQKMEAIGRLAGGIAHDFNNILTVITAYAYLLLDRNPSPADREDIEEINIAAGRASALTRQLLTFSRKAIVHMQPVQLNDVVTGMRAMLQRLLVADIELVTTLRQDLGVVRADIGQLEQVIMNLVVNAADAMPDGGTLTVETDNVELDEAYSRAQSDVTPGAYVMLAVSDTGVGIDDATIGKIFEPFFTTKDPGQGTGLGLATVYAIVDGLGGHLRVYSEVGHGTVFKVYFHRDDSLVASVDAAAAAPTIVGSGTVLLVEDDAGVRRAVKRMLEAAGYSVLDAPDGATGLDLAASHVGSIDVVVTDLMMPNMSGREFADALRRLYPTLRLVFTSGYTDDAVLRRGLLDKTHTFVQKPFTGDQLVNAIHTLLRTPT